MAKRTTFHHGALREALIEAALEEIEQSGPAELSLRDLALRLDVSSGAPYRHFETKQALLVELATVLQTELFDAYSRIATGLDAPGRLRAAAKAYLDIAKRRPRLFQLVFAEDAFWLPVESDDGALQPLAYKLFADIVTAVAQEHGRNSDRNVNLTCWSMLHGFATLRITGRMAGFQALPGLEHRIIANMIDIAARGQDKA